MGHARAALKCSLKICLARPGGSLVKNGCPPLSWNPTLQFVHMACRAIKRLNDSAPYARLARSARSAGWQLASGSQVSSLMMIMHAIDIILRSLLSYMDPWPSQCRAFCTIWTTCMLTALAQVEPGPLGRHQLQMALNLTHGGGTSIKWRLCCR